MQHEYHEHRKRQEKKHATSKCPTCQKWMPTDRLLSHGQDTKCRVCNAEHICHIVKHLAREHDKCAGCHQWFKDKQALAEHLTLPCLVCDLSFCHWSKREEHLKSAHPSCRKCSMKACREWLTDDDAEQEHMAQVHLCTDCKAYYPSAAQHREAKHAVVEPVQGKPKTHFWRRCDAHPKGTDMPTVTHCKACKLVVIGRR